MDDHAEMNDQITIVELTWALLHSNEKGWLLIQELNLVCFFLVFMRLDPSLCETYGFSADA
jgi:hypothetical protein